MTSMSHSQRYIPHDLNTRFYSVSLYRKDYSIAFVCRRYKISKSSLRDKSHRPLTPHPNAHSELEIKWIKDLIRRNPHISMSELYSKLRIEKGYSRTAPTLIRLLRKINLNVNKEKQKKYLPKK